MGKAMTEVELRRRLAANVRRLRWALGLTQEGAAERAGLHARGWQRIEAREANTSTATLVRVAGALAVDPADLLKPIRRR